MNENLKLIDALKVAKNSLIEDSIEYTWDKISQDNVGILAQAITRTDRVSLFEEYIKDFSVRLAKRRRTKRVPSWTDMVSEYWPMTGSPIIPIFIELHEAGLKRSDVYDLEYLTGQIATTARISTDTKKMDFTEVKTKTWGFWIFKKQYEVTVKTTKDVEYYKQKDNLLKFYDTWITELEKEKQAIGGGSLVINGEKFPYRNSFQLLKLKDHFLNLEDYEAANIVTKELEKYKK